MVRHPRRTGHDQIRLVQHPDTGRHVRTARERRRTPEGHRRNHPDGRTVRKPERHRDLPGHRHHARHALQDRARPHEPLQNPPRPDAGHGRRARPRAARRNDPHQLEQVRRQDRREVHHHRHALDQPVRQPVQQGRLQPLRRLLHDPRRPVRHPVHVQAGIRREHDQRQPARQHRVHQSVQTRLRQELRRGDRPDPERHRHRQTRQNQRHGRREERRGYQRKPAGPPRQRRLQDELPRPVGGQLQQLDQHRPEHGQDAPRHQHGSGQHLEVDQHQRMEPQPVRLDQHAEGRQQHPAEGQRG